MKETVIHHPHSMVSVATAIWDTMSEVDNTWHTKYTYPILITPYWFPSDVMFRPSLDPRLLFVHGKESLVHTVCACIKSPQKSWGFGYHRKITVITSYTLRKPIHILFCPHAVRLCAFIISPPIVGREYLIRNIYGSTQHMRRQ